MAKYLFLLAGALIFSVQAANDTINFTIEPVPGDQDGRKVQAASLPCPIEAAYQNGWIEVDLRSPDGRMITLKDESFEVSWAIDGETRCISRLDIDLIRIMERYYRKTFPAKNVSVTARSAEFLKENGKNWRLLKIKNR